MSLNSRLQKTDMNHPQCRVVFVWGFFFFTFSLSSAVSPSAHRPTDLTHHPVILFRMSLSVSCWSVVPGFSAVVWKLTHFTSLQQRRQRQRQRRRHMLRQTHAALASWINRFFAVAQSPELRSPQSVSADPQVYCSCLTTVAVVRLSYCMHIMYIQLTQYNKNVRRYSDI